MPDLSRQPGLFDDDPALSRSSLLQSSTADAPPPRAVPTAVDVSVTFQAPPPQIDRPKTAPAACADRPGVTIITESDLPHYPPDLVLATQRSIADLAPDRVWFCYRDIRKYFGVSRATVFRRLKDGLVPRVRLQGGRVLEEGAVRRFDRVQLLWLLLAVRAGRARH